MDSAKAIEAKGGFVMEIHEKGRQGERRAERYLESLGWKCIGRNVRFKVGEIDLIFETSGPQGSLLILVEVRTRAIGAMANPLESLCGQKAGRLRRAGEAFLARYRGAAREVRMDLVSIEGDEVRHFPDVMPWR
jgi:putative endonuclease